MAPVEVSVTEDLSCEVLGWAEESALTLAEDSALALNGGGEWTRRSMAVFREPW